MARRMPYNGELQMRRGAFVAKRDLLDDFIDIRDDWQAVSNPLGGIADSLVADPKNAPVWNPSDYKERPRPNAPRCLRSKADSTEICHICADVCPVDAIKFEGTVVTVADNCRKCGLCIAACPAEALGSKNQGARVLYNKIARAATIHEDCYITCTRALGRIPQANEIVLPCVGLMDAELWFSLLADYDNISVYLPFGICDKCRTTTGEEFYVNQIGQAEEWAQASVGLEFDEAELNHEQTRAYKRSQFLSSMAKTGATAVMGANPVLAGAKAVAKKIDDHTRQINDLQRSLEKMTGVNNANRKRRTLTKRRELTLGALQKHPDLAANIKLEFPVCDNSLCTMCGDCATACPTNACEIDDTGRFHMEPAYCVNCGACVFVCDEDALSMVEAADAQELVIPDKNVEEVKKHLEEAKASAQKGKKMIKKGLDAIESLADDEPKTGSGK